MPTYNHSLRISSGLFNGKQNCFNLIGNSEGKFKNQYYEHINNTYSGLMFMKLGKTDFYIITDRYINENCTFNLLKTVYWKRESSKYSGHIKNNNRKWLHRFLLNSISAREIPEKYVVHHLGHTFDNRINSLKELPSSSIHGEIHGTYETNNLVGVIRPPKAPDVKGIQTIIELNMLLNSMVSPNYIDYINNPEPVQHRLALVMPGSNKILQLKTYLQPR